jgi:hypothetical protein
LIGVTAAPKSSHLFSMIGAGPIGTSAARLAPHQHLDALPRGTGETIATSHSIKRESK